MTENRKLWCKPQSFCIICTNLNQNWKDRFNVRTGLFQSLKKNKIKKSEVCHGRMIWRNLTAASYSDTEWMFCYLLTGAPALCWERGMLLGWNSLTHYVLWAKYCGGGREEFTLLGSKEGPAQTLCFVEGSGTRLGCVHWPKGNGSNTIRPDFYCHQPLNSIAKKK